MGQVLILDEQKDNVAVALRDFSSGEWINVTKDARDLKFMVRGFIPVGHKISLEQIRTGEQVIKYGYPIGKASQNILPGEHVHINNVKSTRGKELLTGESP